MARSVTIILRISFEIILGFAKETEGEARESGWRAKGKAEAARFGRPPIPCSGFSNPEEEDGRLNRRRGTSTVVDNGEQSHIYPWQAGVHAC